MQTQKHTAGRLEIEYVPITSLRHPERNPRIWSKEARTQVRESIEINDIVDPLIVNRAKGREGITIGGNLRLEILKEMKVEMVPVIFLDIPDRKKEEELIIRLNKNVAEFDMSALAEFDEKLLAQIGFSSEELDEIFGIDEHPEVFDLNKELTKLGIEKIDIKHGDRFKIGDAIVMNGDSTIEADMLALMDGAKADMCLTDPPYLLNYLVGKKKNGKTTQGFGLKRDRTYLGTETLPDNFSELWMANVAKVQKPDFSIMIYENPKNLRTIWNALEQHWKYRNTIIWHVPNRVQGFSAKFKFFNKSDIALLGTSGDVKLNVAKEPTELLQNEYEAALFATSGKPTWEKYRKGKKYCPTDFIEHIASDEKHSGQGIIFGTKPLEVLIPYLKVLTKRGDIVLEPFGGSGSTAAAALKMKRKCYVMEKSNIYTAVIVKRLEKLTGLKSVKIS